MAKWKDLKIHIREDLCKKCEICVNICPTDVLATNEEGYPEVVALERCTGCMLCEDHCPDFAIWVEKDGDHPEHPGWKYLRMNHMPNVWCPGCGIGAIFYALLKAIEKLGIPKDKIAMVSGIGCTGRMPGYADFNTLHTTHGRALAFATGIKLANPDLTVITVLGDGDGLAIGGNHFVHAARRNIDMLTIVVNNFIYGMTGGQVSPTTPRDTFATTAPYGQTEEPFDACEVAKAAGANFVARSTTYHITMTQRFIEQGLKKKGFSLVEVLSQCPTYYGRLNDMVDPYAMLEWQKTHVYRVGGRVKENAFPMGVIHEGDRPEYVETLQQKYAKLRGEK